MTERNQIPSIGFDDIIAQNLIARFSKKGLSRRALHAAIRHHIDAYFSLHEKQGSLTLIEARAYKRDIRKSVSRQLSAQGGELSWILG